MAFPGDVAANVVGGGIVAGLAFVFVDQRFRLADISDRLDRERAIRTAFEDSVLKLRSRRWSSR